ncbi:hypothetical protein J3R82DRAFT_4325 [Butyriboletus roseoflavus]|nr:hypothetical protein J3R82DRAFT_4325 [Butyriboletus roseoflavus]
MLQIEWKSSHYHSDGRPRTRPKASTVHGWLVKWRATFSGNESLRKEGIREMREAKAVRELKKQRKAARQAKAGVSNSRPCPTSLSKEQQPQAPKGLPRGVQRSSSKRPSRGSSRHIASQTHSPRSTPTSSRRSGHNRQGAGYRNPHSSRKASHNSRRDIVRVTEKKR